MTTRTTHSGSRQRGPSETATRQSDLPPLSEEDRCRLLREWTDANARCDLDARRRIEAEILGTDPASTPGDGSDGSGP